MTRRLLAALCGVLLVVTGCASMPRETDPQVIGSEDTATADDVMPNLRPTLGLSANDTVRKFVVSGQEATDYREARLYLTKRAAAEWEPSPSVVILQDQFNAVPVDPEHQPDDPNKIFIRVRGSKIGTLGADDAFTPGGGMYQTEMLLSRDTKNQQWRIVNPPTEMITTERRFEENYYRIPLYYFAPNSTVPVPDPRYMLAQPREGLPGRIVDTLLQGPSDALATAVDNPLASAQLDTNVTVDADGALEVPLTGVSGESTASRRLMALQLVMSLEAVATNRIRLLSDGNELVLGHRDWRFTDVPPVGATMSANLPGLALYGNQVVRLDNGEPIDGPAGAGNYAVQSAAQSMDGGRIAVVEDLAEGVRLLVGPMGSGLATVDLDAERMTRPTWRPSYSGGNASNEVWTVVNGRKVVRAVLTLDGVWQAVQVNDAALEGFGPISALRLSRDGTRAAIVAGHKLVMASVTRTSDSVRLRAPRILQPETLTDVIDVDWLGQDTLVAATTNPTRPVVSVSVDGFSEASYTTSNLEPPVSAVTAAPGRPVVAANAGGLWETSDLAEVWRQSSRDQIALHSPFYPG